METLQQLGSMTPDFYPEMERIGWMVAGDGVPSPQVWFKGFTDYILAVHSAEQEQEEYLFLHKTFPASRFTSRC